MFRSFRVLAFGATILLAGLRLATAEDRFIDVTPYSYAAIAYNPESGDYGYAYNYRSRERAEQEALKRCPGKDSRIVCWVNHGFCSLALGDDNSAWGTGYTFGNGCSLRPATRAAVDECQEKTTGVRVVLAMSSDGQVVFEE